MLLIRNGWNFQDNIIIRLRITEKNQEKNIIVIEKVKLCKLWVDIFFPVPV